MNLLFISYYLITYYTFLFQRSFNSTSAILFLDVVYVCVWNTKSQNEWAGREAKRNKPKSVRWTVDALIYIFSHYFAFLWKVQ